MMNKKTTRKYNNTYYDQFLFPKTKNDVKPSEYLFRAMNYLHEDKVLLDSFFTILRITDNEGNQLFLTLDRDFFYLNWKYFDKEKGVRSRTLEHWTNSSRFDCLSYEELEERLLAIFQEYKTKTQK